MNARVVKSPEISLSAFAETKKLATSHCRFCTPTMVPQCDPFTLASKMAELGVSLSFSRPRVSNDNAFAESLFRTMKYHQSYPLKRFRDLVSVRAWVDGFVEWYNTEHRHSGIKYVTPNQRHYGQADAICAIRQQTYEQTFLLNPQRWTQGPRDWSQPEVVKINHPRPMQSAAA